MTSVGSRHPRRRFAGALFAALPILALHASPAAGAEPTELPEGTISAAVADLDGDGAREVVRMLRPEPESEDRLLAQPDGFCRHRRPCRLDRVRG